MRRFTLALALGALSATAFGQTANCSDCRHIASWFKGEGGFIGTVADGAEEVVFVASCGSVSVTGEARVNGGTAALLFNHRNGLACDQDGGGLEIAGLKDGGWFWVTDDMNSAVGGLVDSEVYDALMDSAVELTSAGDGVAMMAGKGAVYVKETATGRVGILPNILPAEPVAPATLCGYKGAGSGTSPFTRRNTDCMLGDGKAKILATTYNGITNATEKVMAGGMVYRPAGSGTATVTIDLWGNGTGHYLTSTDADAGGTNGINFARGHGAVGGAATATAEVRAGTRYTGVTYAVSAGGGVGGGEEVVSGTPVQGVDHAEPAENGDNALAVTVVASEANCSKTNNYSTPVTVTAIVEDGADGADQVTPSIARAATTNVAATFRFTVMCQPASANQGQELVPENPFPVE